MYNIKVYGPEKNVLANALQIYKMEFNKVALLSTNKDPANIEYQNSIIDNIEKAIKEAKWKDESV